MADGVFEERLIELPPLISGRQNLHRTGINNLAQYFQNKMNAAGLDQILGDGKTIG